jgi:hypothetical protein
MPASAVKVVPPFSPRRLYLFSAVLGCGFGLIMQREETWTFRLMGSDFVQRHLSPVQASILGTSFAIILAFIPAFLIGLILACFSQRRAQAALAAAIVGTVQILVSLLGDEVLWSYHGGADWGDWPLFSFLINVAIIAGVSALCALLVRWLVRSLLFTIVEQDGTRCSRCGYQLGGPTITTCPECGAPADTARLSFSRLHRLTAWLQRRSPIFAAIFVVFLAIQLPVTIYRRTLPTCRFLAAFPIRDNVGQGSMSEYPPPPDRHDSSCLASWVPFPNESLRGIIVLYVPDSRSTMPAMRLCVAATPTPRPPDAPPLPTLNFGTPEVGCELPRDLAERVIREGIPPALIKALADEADRAKWTPTTAPTGFFTAVQPNWVNPAPFFAAP